MDPSNNQISDMQLDQQEAMLAPQSMNTDIQHQINNNAPNSQSKDMNGLSIPNDHLNPLINESQVLLSQIPPPQFDNASQSHQQQNSINAGSMPPIPNMVNHDGLQAFIPENPATGDKQGWEVIGAGPQEIAQKVPQQDDPNINQNIHSITQPDHLQKNQQSNAGANIESDYLAQQKQLTVGLIQPFNQQTQQHHQLDEQAIEKRLLDQDNQSMLDSNSTSNLNLDSGTVKDKDAIMIQTKQGKQVDPFKNFDYDKNQSKHKDDEYPDPPSFLLNESSLVEDKDQRDQRQASGLPQPYEPTVYYDFKDFPDLKWEPFKDEAICPASSYFDARNFENNGDKMENLLKGGTNKPILFDLQNTWLKGEQYAHILQNQDRYCQTFGIQKYDYKQHPESIYIDPKDGLLYFVQGESIGSDFGFPRLGIRKRFKWKKMNFTTDLPKRDPLVSYIVASAVKCEKFFPGSNDDGPVYRMHAVILKKRDMTLQLPSEEGFDVNSAKRNDQKESQEALNQIDKQSSDQQPRSKHGRVLTKSTKLKAAQNNSVGSAKKSNCQGGGVAQSVQKDEQPYKNYILCHVRRVMGKRDEEFESDGNEDSPVKKEASQTQNESQKQQCSKIPNKGKNKFDQIPLQFSEELLSPGKDKKIPNLKMFQGLSLDQIKKMKVGPDGKPLSLYKIKKYILPYNKLMTDQQNQIDQLQSQNKHDEEINDLRISGMDDEEINEEPNELKQDVESVQIDDSPIEPVQINQQQNSLKGRKRKNNMPIQELENQASIQSGTQNKNKNKIQNTGQKMTDLEVVDQVLGGNKDKSAIKIEGSNKAAGQGGRSHKQKEANAKKQINVEMLDQNSKQSKNDTNNGNQKNKENDLTPNGNQLNDQINQQPQENNQAMNTAAGLNQLGGLGNQGPFNLNNFDQALALSLLNGGNNFGLNNLGLQNAFGGVNGLMFNQLNALQNLSAQNNINQLLGANPNSLGLNVDLSLQNQLLGLNNNLGLNNFGYGLNGINGINNLLNMNQLQNLNGLLGQNPLGNLNTLHLQQNLLNQNGQNSHLISKLQDQLKLNNQLNFDNQLLLMNQHNGGAGNADNGLNIGDLFNQSLMKGSKDGKGNKKIDSMKQLEQLKNSAISPNLLQKDTLNNNGVSPQLKNINSTLMNAFMNNGSTNTGGNQKRKHTQENPNPFFDDLKIDLYKYCQNEYTRRQSGQMKFNVDDQKSQNLSPKSHNMSNFSKSPNLQGTANKFGDNLNTQMNQNYSKRKKSMVSNFGRDRLNSNISAFKKFNQPNAKEKDMTTSPLIEGKQGEPSFGPDSIHDSKSIATLRAPKNSVEGSTMQNISKRNDSNPNSNQNNIKGGKQQNQNLNNMLEQQQLLLQQMQLLGQFPGQGLDQFNLGNLNNKLSNQNAQNGMGQGGNLSQLNGLAGQQMKGGNSQQSHQQYLLQQQQIQLLLQYHCQQGQMLQNQLLNQGLNMGSYNNPLDLLGQPLLNGNNNGGPNDKIDSKALGNILQNNKQSNDSVSKNQQLNVFQNTHLQPVISGVIVNQFGATNGSFDNLGGMQCFQGNNRKDSFRGSKNNANSLSPNIGQPFSRSRGNSQKDSQFINDLKKALAPNPTNCGQQPQDQNFGGNLGQNRESMIIPTKQQSHRNSNISQQNLMKFGARKSTDITPLNQHKFSITGVINNPPSFHQNHQYNQNSHGQGKMQHQSQLSNNSNKLASSHPISQENQQLASPDRNFDSSYSQKQESHAKINLQQASNQELMKSPGVFPASARSRTIQTSRRKQSSNFDINNKQNGQQQSFIQPTSRQSGILQDIFGPSSQNIGEPKSGSKVGDDFQKQNNGKSL